MLVKMRYIEELGRGLCEFACGITGKAYNIMLSPPRPMRVRLKAAPAADIGSAWRQSPARALMLTMETTD